MVPVAPFSANGVHNALEASTCLPPIRPVIEVSNPILYKAQAWPVKVRRHQPSAGQHKLDGCRLGGLMGAAAGGGGALHQNPRARARVCVCVCVYMYAINQSGSWRRAVQVTGQLSAQTDPLATQPKVCSCLQPNFVGKDDQECAGR